MLVREHNHLVKGGEGDEMSFFRWRNILHFSSSSFILFVLTVCASPARLAQGTSGAPVPLTIAVVFDLSVSTASLSRQSPTVKPKDLKQVLSPLFQPDSHNQYFIIGVSTVPQIILDGSMNGEATLKALSKLASLPREGATALYDACFLGIRKVTRPEPSKRVLLVVSDGVDTISHKSLNEVKSALVDRQVKLYAIVTKTDDKTYREGAKSLDELASISGGESFYPKNSKDLKAIMESIVAKLQQ